MSAYAGPRDLLEVDLTARTWRKRALGDDVFADALGGVALAVRLIDERVRGPLEPLDHQGIDELDSQAESIL